MPKKKSAAKKKPAAKRKAKTAAPKRRVKKKAAAKRAAPKLPLRPKRVILRGPAPIRSGLEPAASDEHGPMHLPSHKPVPAYAQMHQNDWAGKPPTHNIPIPKH